MSDTKINIHSESPERSIPKGIEKDINNIPPYRDILVSNGLKFSQVPAEQKEFALIDVIKGELDRIHQSKDRKFLGDYTNTSAEDFVRIFKQNYCADFSQIQSFAIIQPNPEYKGDDSLPVGQVRIRYLPDSQGKQSADDILSFLPSMQRLLIDTLAEKNKLKKRIKTGEEKLKEDIDTESYMDGNLIVVYKTLAKTAEHGLIPALGLWGAAGSLQGAMRTANRAAGTEVGRAAINTGRMALDGASRDWSMVEKTRIIDGIFYRNLDGKMIRVDTGNIPQLDIARGVVPDKLLSLLQQKGIIMDPISGRFSPVSYLTMRDVVKNFEYIQAPEGISESEWRKFQTELRQMELEYQRAVSSGKISPSIVALQDFLKSRFTQGTLKGLKFIKGKMLHIVFWPVFFKKYHANMQDRGAFNACFAEAGAFMAGAKLGSKIPVPPAFKAIAGLAAGGLAVMAGEHAAEALDLDKHYWIVDPDREDHAFKDDKNNDGNSKSGNVISGGFIYRQLDKMGGDFAISPKGGLDLRLPSISMNLPRKTGEGIGGISLVQQKVLESGKDIYFPRIAFLETSVSFQTNPREYMGAAMGRDVTLWNNRVDEYRMWLTNTLEGLRTEYDKAEGIFRKENISKIEIDPESDFYQQFILSRRIDPKDPDQKNVKTKLAKMKDPKNPRTYIDVPVEFYDETEMKKRYLYNLRVFQMLGADGNETLKKLWTAPHSIQNAYSMRSIANRTTEWLGYRDEKRKQNTSMLVANMTDQMKIDNDYIMKETLDLRTRELALGQRLANFSNQFSGRKKEYVLDLFRRIRVKERMIKLHPEDEEKWKKADRTKMISRNGNGFELQVPPHLSDRPVMSGRPYGIKFFPNQEYVWWKELLESKEKYKPSENGEDNDVIEKLEGKNLDKALSGGSINIEAFLGSYDLKSGDVFYQLLKDMVEFKRQEEFVRNIQQYGTGQKWFGPNTFDILYSLPSDSKNSPPKPNPILQSTKENPLQF